MKMRQSSEKNWPLGGSERTSHWGMHSQQRGAVGTAFVGTFCAWVGLLTLAACGPLGGVEGDGAFAGAGGQAAASAGAGNGASAGAVVLPDPPAFKVVGYEPQWASSLAGLQIDKLDYVNFAFVLEAPDGSVAAPAPAKMLVDLVSAGHAVGTRVLLSVGGWNNGNDSAFETLAANADARAKFASTLDGYVDQFQLDGVDIDWEFPGAASANNFTAMIRELSAKLKPKGKLVTIAGAAFSDGAAGVTAEALAYIDLVNIMAYDGDPGAGHSPYAFAQSSLQLWLGKGLPASKAMLGVPFYSQPSYKTYSELIAKDPANANLDQVDVADTSGTVKRQYYNGIPTIQAKTALAMSSAGGIMAWDLSQDSHTVDLSLLSAIYSKSHPGL